MSIVPIDSATSPVGKIIKQLNVGDPAFTVSPGDPVWQTGNIFAGYTGVILCVDLWGAGGNGGTGNFVGKDGFIGGGGAAGNFTRVYIQAQKLQYVVPALANYTLSISSGGIFVLPDLTTNNGTQTIAPVAGASGGNWTPAGESTSPAAGAASLPTAISTVQSTDSLNVIFNQGDLLPTFPSDLQVVNSTGTIYSSTTILNTTDLPMQLMTGAAGQSGWAGGAGGAPTESGGVRAGWGGSGTGRSRSDLPAGPGPAMAIVYLVAATTVNPISPSGP